MLKQKGFTLVEILTVLVILGILAAVGIPRFIDLTGSAEKSVVMEFVGELKSARVLAFSRMALGGLEYSDPSDLDFDSYVQADGNPNLWGGEPTGGYGGNTVGMSSIRDSIFDNPNQGNVLSANSISFTTQSGRAVVISINPAGDIVWSASPGY